MWSLRILVYLLMLLSGVTKSGKCSQRVRGNNDICGVLHTEADQEVSDAVIENQSCETWELESSDLFLESSGEFCESVVLEESVWMPSSAELLNLDIILSSDMFVEFHESHQGTDSLHFRLSIDYMGDNTSLPEFFFDYRVVSLGPETKVILHVVGGDAVGNVQDGYMSYAAAFCAVVISFIVAAGRERRTTATVPSRIHDNGQETSSKHSERSYRNVPGRKINTLLHIQKCQGHPHRLKDQVVSESVKPDKQNITRHVDKEKPKTEEKEVQEIRNASIASSSALLTGEALGEKSGENTHLSGSNMEQVYQHQDGEHILSKNTGYLQLTSTNHDERKTRDNSHHLTGLPSRARFRIRSLAFLLVATLAAVAVSVGVFKIRAKPTLHVTFPASPGLRKVRMFSDYPDLTQLTKNYSSLSLLSRLQLLDTKRCKDDFKSCTISVVCDSSTDQSINCRCRHGYFFLDWQCHVCTSQCPDDHYLVSSCSAASDAVCKPCTECSNTQYAAAQCNTNRDTICIDVSFPVGILPFNKSHLPDDGIEISGSYSSNVFMERLIDMEALETPMYVTNNQQSLDFVWPRLSGLDIAVSVTGVFLVPDYHDLEAIDDTTLFHKLPEPSQNTKDYYNYIQNYYCRHPVPDYYSLQLEVIANRTSVAQVIRCDAQDDSVPRCPDRYKDGDRYLKWNINTPCSNYKTTKLTPLKDGPNSVVCTDETDLLRKVFQTSRPTTQEYMFPSRECEMYRWQCEQCLNSASCPATSSNETYLEDSQCCGIHCYTQTPCKKIYSSDCPTPAVECATGEVNIFSLFPHFDSMDRQFACHLKYVPPSQLYSLSYSVRAPTINFNTTPQYFTVLPGSRSDHERRLSNFDFMSALHDTRMKLEDEFVLIGDHMELTHYHDSLMKPYTIRELKAPKDLIKQKNFTQNIASRTSYIQFERPFLYSSLIWYKDGCHKNVSQIYPNQTIYREDFLPVMARKNMIELEPSKALFRNREFSYQLYHRDRAPFIKFYVEKGKSVLQHLQGTTVKGKLLPSSLHGKVSWHHETSTWKLIFSATQDECPSVISLKIFTQLMTGCAGHFDLLINCPKEFTVTFNFSTGMSDLPDIFVLQVNDSATSHNMVLSSVYPPVYVDEVTTKDPAVLLEEKFADSGGRHNLVIIWTPIIIIVVITLICLLIIYIFYKCINSKAEKVDLSVKGNSEGEAVALNNQREQVKPTVTASGAKPRPKCSIFLFVVLYLIYSTVFTFSLTFCMIYFSHSSLWTNITNSEHLGKELHTQVNKSLYEIKKYEEKEKLRLFTSYQERRKACIHHLESENRKLLLDYESTTKKQVNAVFVENGTLHYFTKEIQKQNVSAYLQQIHIFVADCNKTLHAIIDRFQANYYQFIRNTANNDWLKVPRQIFLQQDGEDPNMKYLSSTQVKQFASWLEIDKAEELFAVKENVLSRISSIPHPHVSTLDITFPSLHPHLEYGLPNIDFDHRFYLYNVLEPLFDDSTANSNSSTSTAKSVTDSRSKRDAEIFGLSGNLKSNPDSIFSNSPDINKSSPKLLGNSSHEDIASHKRRPHKQGKESHGNVHHVDYLQTLDMDIVNAEKDKAASDSSADHPEYAEALTASDPESEPHTTSDRKFYILICVFLFLDVVLWVYRISWLTSQVSAARHGYADRIPTDEACKQVLEIQTAYHLPAFENPHDESSGYYVDVKEQLYVSDRENDMTFLQTLPTPKTKDDVLQKIWNEKMNRSEDRAVVRMQKCFLVRWYGDLRIITNRLFLSQLVWQGAVTFLAVSFISLFVYCAEFWLTPDNFQTLVGGQSAAADVKWHLDTSDHYLHGLAHQLTVELRHMKHLCDSEVDILTDMFFKTVSLQTSMFTATLQGLCREAKGRNCDKIIAHQSTGGRIVGCNFLPLQAQTFHDLSLTHMETIVTREVTPLVNLSHYMLTVSACVVVSLLCIRLLCQATATTVRHYLLLTGRLPRVRVYQSEEPQMTNADPVNTTMQRSQSWVDSCESGVYLGEVDDTNKDENR